MSAIYQDVFGYLIIRYNLHSMIDIGCGRGETMEYFSRFLVHTVGFDKDETAIKQHVFPGHAFLHDFTAGEPPAEILHPNFRFDLAWSTDFLEHVDEQFSDNYMAVFRKCRYAVVVPNCRSDEYWIQRFAEGGFIYSPKETNRLRATILGNHEKRKTLMFFERL